MAEGDGELGVLIDAEWARSPVEYTVLVYGDRHGGLHARVDVGCGEARERYRIDGGDADELHAKLLLACLKDKGLLAK